MHTAYIIWIIFGKLKIIDIIMKFKYAINKWLLFLWDFNTISMVNTVSWLGTINKHSFGDIVRIAVQCIYSRNLVRPTVITSINYRKFVLNKIVDIMDKFILFNLQIRRCTPHTTSNYTIHNQRAIEIVFSTIGDTVSTTIPWWWL